MQRPWPVRAARRSISRLFRRAPDAAWLVLSVAMVQSSAARAGVLVHNPGGTAFAPLAVLASSATPTATPTPLPCPQTDLGNAVPLTVTGSTTGASDTFAGSCGGTGGPDHSFRYTAPATGFYSIDTFGSAFDTVLYVRSGTCGGTQIACNDDTSGTQSQVIVQLTAAQVVTIFVDGFQGANGAFTLHIAVTQPPATPTQTLTPTQTFTPTPTYRPALNDTCAAATVITAASYLSAEAVGAAVAADPSDPTPTCDVGSRGKTVWYRYTPSSNSIVTANTFGSSYDTVLSVYTGSCGGFVPVLGACNDDGIPGTYGGAQSQVTFAATAGVTYYFLVSAFNNDGGILSFQLSANSTGIFTVNSTADGADANPGNGVCATGTGTCTVRAAIQEANAQPGPNTIILPAGTYTLTIGGAGENAAQTGDLDITDDVSLFGAGAATTIIDAKGLGDRVFDIRKNTVTVTLSGVTIQNGTVSATGGGINNIGTLTLNNCVVSDNQAIGSATDGGGVYNTGLLTLSNSSILNNTASGDGGGIANTGALVAGQCTISGNKTTGNTDGGGINTIGSSSSFISNSTLSGNLAGRDGGAIHAGASGGVSLINSTISGNMANVDGGGIYANSPASSTGYIQLSNVTVTNNTADADNNGTGDGGGIRSAAANSLDIFETIIAGNTDRGGQSPDCASVASGLGSGGYNLIGKGDGCIGQFANTDLVGSIAVPLDPHLGPLQNNGGPTQTHALLAISPAIDVGLFSLSKDQRGYPRINGSDLGAYEFGSALTPTPTLTTTPTFTRTATFTTTSTPTPTGPTRTPTRTPTPAPPNLWLSYGPDGGYILALAVDPKNPSKVYASTATAELFRSIDGGSTWAPTGSPGQIFALVIDPTTTTTLYAATGSGASTSTDGGATWTQGDGVLATGQTLAIDPATPGTLYLGTNQGGVFKSTDAGAHWNAVNNGLSETNVFAIAVAPTVPTAVYAGTFSGVFKSTDGGASWTPVNNGLTITFVSALVVDPTTPSTVYAATFGGGVFKTTNGGTTWTAKNSGLSLDLDIGALTIDPAVPATLYAGSVFGGVSKTVDGGSNWIAMNSGLPPARITALAISPSLPTTVYAGTSAGVFKSVDDGTSWNAVITGLRALPIYGLAVEPALPSNVYAGTSGAGILKSAYGGASWIPVNAGLPSSGTNTTYGSLMIDPTHPDTVYAAAPVGGSGACYGAVKTTDGAQTWSAANSGFFQCATALVLDPTSPATLYATAYAAVFKSTDGGSNWQSMSSGLPDTSVQSIAIDPTTPATVYAGTGAGVFKTTDGGANWNFAGLSDTIIPALAIAPTNPPTIYAGAYYGIFKSVNGGATWSAASPDFTASVQTVVVDPTSPTTVYAGTYYSGVFKTVDGGAHWGTVDNGLTNLNVHTLAVDPLTPSTVYAGTDAGVFVIHNPVALLGTPTPTPVPCPARNLGGSLPVTAFDNTGTANNVAGSCGGLGPERTFAYTVPQTGVYTIDTFGSSFDTVLYIWNGVCGGPEIACNDDSNGGTISQLTVSLTAGQSIVIVVDSYDPSGGGSIVLNVNLAPTPTPTRTHGSPTATPTAHCGNGAIEPGESCDDGGTCIGGTNAGTHCTAESDCVGTGVCVGGTTPETVCSTDADCAGGACRHCVPFGGDGCAANCTTESDVPLAFVSGITDPVNGSTATIHTEVLDLPLPLSGAETLTVGQQVNGQIPVVVKSTSFSVPKIDVSGLLCACLRGVNAKTCGGTLFEADGAPSTDCTAGFTAGDALCVGKKPCTFVYGSGNAAAGVVGCGGLPNGTAVATQDSLGSQDPPQCATPGVGAPVCAAAAQVTFGADGSAGATLLFGTTALNATGTSCANSPTLCTNADAFAGTPLTAPWVAGTASGEVSNINGEDGVKLGPFSEVGSPLSCNGLTTNALSGAALAFSIPQINPAFPYALGDWVVTGAFHFAVPTQAATATVTPSRTGTPTITPTVTQTPTPPQCPQTDLGNTVPLTVSGSTTGAQNHQSGSCGGASAAEKTFRYTAPLAGTYSIDTFGSSIDTILYVRNVTCAGAELACNDDATPDGSSQVSVTLTAGQAVVIVVDGYGTLGGNFQLNITRPTGGTPTPTAAPVCGNGIVESGEDCDDGGTCIGSTNAGTHCKVESDCAGNGVCTGGTKPERACATNADCPGGTCRRCVPFGGDGCAANCTNEMDVPFNLLHGSSDASQGSADVLHTDPNFIGDIPLPFGGSQTLTVGKQRNGAIPVAIKATAVSIPKIDFAGVSCVCLRGVEAKTCGGTVFASDGSLSAACTDGYTAGAVLCPADKPCAPVHGAGNAAAGTIGCTGLPNATVSYTQDSLGSQDPPACLSTPGLGAPVCAANPVVSFSADAHAGAALLFGSTSLSTLLGTCATSQTFCTDADPIASRGEPVTVPWTTGTATGEMFNINGEDGVQLGPFAQTGVPFSCSALANGTAPGVALAWAETEPNSSTIGDIVVTGLFQAVGSTPTPPPTPTPTPAGPCVGDCGGALGTTIDEVQRCVNIFLGTQSVTTCSTCDRNHNTFVSIDEVQAAVNAFLADPSTCPRVNM